MGGGSGRVKIGWCKGPPHTPTTRNVLSEEGLGGNWVHMELSIKGGLRVSHADRVEAEYVRNEKSDEGKSENW